MEDKPLRWMGALVVGRRYCATPTLHQPLSHGASRRDSSPFRGAEGWAEVCGVYASVSHDADTYVAQPPVRGGVLDAPRSRDRRGGLVADVRHGRLHPRHPRCVCLRPPPNVCYFAGAARAPFGRSVGPPSSVIRRKGRRGRCPLRWLRVGTFQRSREVGGQCGYDFPYTLRCVPQRSTRSCP